MIFYCFTVFFEGCFRKSGCFLVVFCWCDRGGMRGEGGVLAACFSSLKNAPTFQLYFWFAVLPDGPPARRAVTS